MQKNSCGLLLKISGLLVHAQDWVKRGLSHPIQAATKTSAAEIRLDRGKYCLKKVIKASAACSLFCISFTSNSFAETVSGCFDMVYSASGVSHESRLVMQGSQGYMRTRYFDPIARKTNDVGQIMLVGSSPRGILIYGYEPVYFGTSIRHPSYSPDNFLFSISPNGSYVSLTCDDEGKCSEVDITVCP
jgi:hypothetical protein